MLRFHRTTIPTLAVLVACCVSGPLAGCSESQINAIITGVLMSVAGGQANAQTGTGGNAGEIYAHISDGGAGAIAVSTSGVVDASFTPTPFPLPNLGANPLVVASDTVIGLPPTEPPAGVAYAILNDGSIYISDGNSTRGDEPPVTGVQIVGGVLLTLPINDNGSQGATFDFTNDFVNDGILSVVDFSASQRGSVNLFTMGSYYGTGTVETYGQTPGQHGGGINIDVEGDVLNAGAMRSYGADNGAGDGGDGGDIALTTDPAALSGKMENTGTIDSHGGSATGGTGVGGDAGDAILAPYLALWNSADVMANGGAGVTGGGDGGDVLIAGFYRGELWNSGNLYTDGGDTLGGSGGDAGDMALEAWGAGLLSSGMLSATGGSSAQASGIGGGGGQVYFYVTYSDDNFEPVPLNVPAGDLMASGLIDGSGGTAMGPSGIGGNADLIEFEIDNDLSAGTQSIRLFGYSSLDARGGAGFVGGTSTGITMDVGTDVGSPTGPISIQPTADASGGYANPAQAGSIGGDAGDITLTAGSISYTNAIANGGPGETPGANGTITPAS